MRGGNAVASGTSNMFFYMTIFIIILIFLAAGGVAVFMIIRALQYNKKIEIYEETNGVMYLVGRDKVKEVKYNVYGDSIFVLRKRKKFLPRGELKAGKNLYFYFIGDDGEWVNFRLTNLNKKLNEADVKFIHPDMRAFKSGTAKIIKDSFQKEKFMEKYGHIVVPIIVFVIIGIALYFIADRVVAGIDKSNAAMDVAGKVIEKADNVLSSLNNICSSSGYKAG